MYLKNSRYFSLVLVLGHLILGFLLTVSVVSKIFTLLVFIYALTDIIRSKNKNNEAFLWAFYFVGAEVLLRMTKGTFSWEMVKYITMLFLFMGMFVENNSKGIPVVFLLYMLLLSIGIAFTNIPAGESLRKAVVFNLSGPLTLGVSAMYFYRRKIHFEKFKEILLIALLPVLSMLTLLYFRTPSLKEITFNTSANFVTSGGFGPNQVATILGFGIFLLASLLLLNTKITGYRYMDYLILFYLIYRSLLTFSRGGIITGVFCFIVLSFIYLYAKGNGKIIFKYLGIFVFIIAITWVVASSVTGGMLANRYMGKNRLGVEKDISTGRVKIFEQQLETFMEHPVFGIGIGSGKYLREDEFDGGVTAASHNEIGRLIEEHGLIGIFALLLLIISFGTNFFRQSIQYKGFVAAFAAFWFLTINHSAMRIAFPGFIYGLSLIHLYDEQDEMAIEA